MFNYDSDDSYSLQKRPRHFVTVDRPSREINLDTIPTNAMEYLQQVQFERKYCPATVTSDIDPERFRCNQSVLFEAGNGKDEIPDGFLPSREFRNVWLQKFARGREQLFRKKDLYKQRYTGNRKYLPKMNNMLGWCAFCLGEDVVEEVKEHATENDLVQFGKPTRFQLHPEAYSPFIHFVIFLVAPEIEKLLSYHSEWLRYVGFSHQLGKWMLALLACLELPLSPNGIAILRNLARICSQLRCRLRSKDADTLIPLNMIICLIAEYFGQKDLADPESSEK